jgi:DNA-binding transcriptional MocR family regulator
VRAVIARTPDQSACPEGQFGCDDQESADEATALDGTLEPGQPAPSITRLSQEHGHARPTCSKALRILEGEGLLTRIPGLGYYVNRTPAQAS